jgi:hypothetical protein
MPPQQDHPEPETDSVYYCKPLLLECWVKLGTGSYLAITYLTHNSFQFSLMLEMLYFSVILCIRQRFITVTVYTLRGTNIPHVSLHYMFWPDGAIFRYIGVYNRLFLFLLLSPHWPVRCMYGLYTPSLL